MRKRNEEREEEGTGAGVEEGELEETACMVGVSVKEVEQEPDRAVEADEAAGTKGEALREVFTTELAQLTPTNATNIEERNRLPKLKKLPPEIAKCANKILSEYLKSSNKLEEITDAVYAMGRAIARLLNVKMKVPGIGRRLNREGNTRERRLRNQIKTLR